MQSSTPLFYEILEVPKDASRREIRRSYLRLAQKYHPDLNAENENADHQFKQIRRVYEILSDPIRRTAYDQNPSSFHLEEKDSWSKNPIVTEPAGRPEARPYGSDSFQPNWATTSGGVGGWLIVFAVASLAVAATAGVAMMLVLDRSIGEPIQLGVVQSDPSAEDQPKFSDPAKLPGAPKDSMGSEPSQAGEAQGAPAPPRERLAIETLAAEPEWWTIAVQDPEKDALDWLSEGSSGIAEPEWTRLTVPELHPNIDDETPIAAPEWANIAVPDLQPLTDGVLHEQTDNNDSSAPLLPPEWAEMQVPDLSEASPIHQDAEHIPSTLPPKSVGSLSPRRLTAGQHPADPIAASAYRSVSPPMRRQSGSHLSRHFRPNPLRPTLPSYLTRPRLGARAGSADRNLLMSGTRDDYQRRHIPPISRYGGQLPDVPPAYSIPTKSWLDR